MMTLYELSLQTSFILLNVMLLIKTIALILFVLQIIRKRNLWLCANTAVLFVVMQIIYECTRAVHRDVQGLDAQGINVAMIGKVPVIIVVAATIVIGIWIVLLIYESISWRRRHITSMSFNECLDNLPSGICCYYESGMTSFVNSAMNKISFAITGKIITNGIEFRRMLLEGNIIPGNEMVEQSNTPIIRLSDGTVYIFRFSDFYIEKYRIYAIQAVDITQEYEGLQKLAEEKAHMEEINNRLREYSKSVINVNIEREILEAKIKIHDKLGHALMLSKRYLSDTKVDKDSLLELWRMNVALLVDEHLEKSKDVYDSIFDIAGSVGVRIIINGELPQSIGKERDVVATALSEYLSNMCKYSDGDEIGVTISNEKDALEVVFVDNGESPKVPIVEGGGLGGLRKLVEGENGIMEITDQPFVRLRILIPRKELS